jgi:hypothetical protein
MIQILTVNSDTAPIPDMCRVALGLLQADTNVSRGFRRAMERVPSKPDPELTHDETDEECGQHGY